jgi:hypothetical protein
VLQPYLFFFTSAFIYAPDRPSCRCKIPALKVSFRQPTWALPFSLTRSPGELVAAKQASQYPINWAINVGQDYLNTATGAYCAVRPIRKSSSSLVLVFHIVLTHLTAYPTPIATAKIRFKQGPIHGYLRNNASRPSKSSSYLATTPRGSTSPSKS